jgi:hypothetical protein
MDALCSWERSTTRTNLVLIVEPESDYVFLALDGKPERTRDVMTILSSVRSELDRLAIRQGKIQKDAPKVVEDRTPPAMPWGGCR